MPFNGNTFTRLYSWVANAAQGIKIRSDLMDNDTNDIANGLTAVATSISTLSALYGGSSGAANVLSSTPAGGTRSVQARLDDFFSINNYPGIDPSGGTDCTAAVQAAFAYAFANGLQMLCPGTYKISDTIPNFHGVDKIGLGKFINGANTFWVTILSSQTNNLYVDPAGNDANDGLTAAKPMKTLQQAVNMLLFYGPVLNGIWSLNLAAGTYTNGVTFPAGMYSQNYIQVNGPTGALPFAPTAIVDGTTAVTTFAFNMNGNANVLFNNVWVKNFALGGNGYGWIAQEFTQIQLVNCFCNNVDNPVKNQQGRTYITGGGYWDGQVGMTMISGETHSIGYGATIRGSVTVATTAASGTGTVATITFPAQATAPVVGSLFRVRGVTPTAYNGVFVVTASTTTTVSYASTATGAQTVAGVCGYNFGTTGVGPLIANMSIQGCLFQENATGHLDYTCVDGCGVPVEIVSSSRANANFSSITGATAVGVRYRSGSNWVNQSCELVSNAVDEVAGVGCLELNRAGGWTGEAIQPVDISFQTLTGTTAATTLKTYATAIQTNSFNSSLKRFRMVIYGELTGTAGTKNVTVNFNGSPAFGFTIPAAATGSYVIEAVVIAQSASAQSYRATCGASVAISPQTGSRSIAMVTGSPIVATVVGQLGNAADTISLRGVDQISGGGC